MSIEHEEFVSILVPKRHLTQIYGYIASLNGTATVAKETAPEAKDDEWDRELIERQYRESPDSMKQFQKHLAANPGREFSTTEVADAIGAEYGWNSVAGALGAYGRRVKNRYKRSTFPFQQRWNHEKGEMMHSMTPEVAAIINEL